MFCNIVDKEIDDLLKYPMKDYGSKERQTLMELSKRPNIIWKPADEGGGLVLMDKSDYVSEVKSQLLDD